MTRLPASHDPAEPVSTRLITRVVIKALLLFALANLVVALLPLDAFGRLTFYNWLLPGRERFPFGENSQKSYNLSLYNLNAMFRAHEIHGSRKPENEYRVVVIGDSSTWGTLLRPEETLAGQLNALQIGCEDKTVRAYNLGYPTISLAKDVMLLRRALAYQPDLILWPTTLEAFPRDKQLASPLAANNAAEIHGLALKENLRLDESELAWPNFWQRTLIGQRRALADLLRLQLYGVMWAATGIDQEYPDKFQPAQVDYEADASYHGWNGPEIPANGLAWDVLEAGVKMARGAGVQVLLVNEPMLISTGRNSDVRYNFFYPRWAYDSWRAELTARAGQKGWNLVDAWDLLPPAEFTNSAIHLTPGGEETLARLLIPAITDRCAGQ